MERNLIDQTNYDEIETYTAEEIMQILKIGKTAVYDLIKDSYKNNKNFKVLKIGKLYRIPKNSFCNWFSE